MKTFLIVGLLSFGAFAYSGEKGNGGYSVVCRTEQGQITSAELLDIYEGRVIHKKNFAVDLNSVDDLIDLGRERLTRYPEFLQKIDKEIKIIDQNIVFIPEGNELEETDDAFPPIKKKGCKFEQLANYQDSGEVLVSQEIYDQLDNVNKAALILHEAIYSFRRKALGEVTSVNSRRLVAEIMATNTSDAVIDRWVGDIFYRTKNKIACGLDGSINERIESCSYIQLRTSSHMVLVTRTKDLKEIWLDETNQLLFSDRLAKNYNFETAKTICGKPQPEMAGIAVRWRLPSMEEYTRMSQVYMQTLPNMSSYSNPHWFWTSTVRGRTVFIFNGADGTVGSNVFIRSNTGSVRCAASLL
jgi:hypothetical protein